MHSPDAGAVAGASLLSGSYALAQFSRTAGTVLVVALAASFQADIADVSRIATVFFWVYALLQLPAGVLADALGSRRLAMLGAVTMGVGSLCFAAAQHVDGAVLARGVVAAGCSVMFVSMMRHVRAHWVERRVATISGRCILVGNLGAIASVGPLSLLLTHLDWRAVSAAMGLASLAIAAVLWFVMAPTPSLPQRRSRLQTIVAELRCVARNPWNHVGLWMMAGLAGSYYGLASLWLMPMLAARGAVAGTAAWQASLLIAGFAVGACGLGWLGDHSSRRGTLAAACCGAVLCWSLLAAAAPAGNAGFAVLLFVLGFCSGGFNLIYALVTERNVLAHAGTATAFVNVGIFVGAGLSQTVSARLYLTNHADFGVVLLPMLLGATGSALLSLSLMGKHTVRAWTLNRRSARRL